ncbi:hypothetical protein [Aerococcus urinaeequi]|uniref:Uncharacterized protein n=1 Tax=Aerococcus urinaeequi TaxID=51665 RepID=A0AAC8X1Q3_9LACT|nr:hypothetical protein [Aerococcus urinaeequi]AMB98067.1 hypothetical protein AWM74_07405 [Aerococcus urinaeequi]
MTPDEEPQLTRAQYRALKNKIDHTDKTVSEVADEIQESKRPSQSTTYDAPRDARHKKSATINRDATAGNTQVFKRDEDFDAPRKFSADMLNQALYEKKSQQAKARQSDRESRPERPMTNRTNSNFSPTSQRPTNQNSTGQGAWTNQDDHVVTAARTSTPLAEEPSVEETTKGNKKRLSFRERLFGPSEEEVEDERDEETLVDDNEGSDQSQQAFFGAGNAEANPDKANQFGQNSGQVDADGKQADIESSKGKSFFGLTKIDRFLNIAIVLLTLGIIILTIIAFYV